MSSPVQVGPAGGRTVAWFSGEFAERIAAAMGRTIEAMLPPDWDCPYPLDGGVNVRLPFEEDA